MVEHVGERSYDRGIVPPTTYTKLKLTMADVYQLLEEKAFIQDVDGFGKIIIGIEQGNGKPEKFRNLKISRRHEKACIITAKQPDGLANRWARNVEEHGFWSGSPAVRIRPTEAALAIIKEELTI